MHTLRQHELLLALGCAPSRDSVWPPCGLRPGARVVGAGPERLAALALGGRDPSGVQLQLLLVFAEP